MSSDEEDIIFYYYLRYRRRQHKRYWVHPYIENNHLTRLYIAVKELEIDDDRFKRFYTMKKQSFDELLRKVTPFIEKQNVIREPVCPSERLLITLRYLGTGDTFTALSDYFCRGTTTVCDILNETTFAIWECLKESEMAIPTHAEWLRRAERFNTLWNLPNCIGACDGKHVRIQKIPNTGSRNYNYKQYHSVVMLASCDADGFFTTIEVGFAGRNSDGGIFQQSALSRMLLNQSGDLPNASRLPNDQMNNSFPYYFVADEAFPLRRYLMRPFPQRSLNNIKRIFNYRLSRGRKTIECAFGMLRQKFQVFGTPIRCINIDKINNIIKAACVLHNFVRRREGIRFNTSERRSDLLSSRTRRIIRSMDHRSILNISTESSPQSLRNYLAEYFIQPQSSLPWQWEYCNQHE